MLVAGCLVLAAAVGQGTASATTLPIPSKPGNPVCLNPAANGPEAYGPTDIGAALGGQRLQVAVNPEGVLSVFRWPSRSYFEQLKYFTTSRDAPRLGLEPNEGAFSGLALKLRDGSEKTVWLRDLHTAQRYASPDSDSVLTTYRSRKLGLRVDVLDSIPAHGDVLLRRHTLTLAPHSPVASARLISFANFNPAASRHPLLPTKDWCEEADGNDRASYEKQGDAIVYSTTDLDQATGKTQSVAVAFGASRPSAGHQVGSDTYTGYPELKGAPSAYDDAADGRLSGNDSLSGGEVDSALSYDLQPGRPLTVVFGAASTPRSATRLVDRWRHARSLRVARKKRSWYLHWLRRAPLPRGAPGPITRLAKRALIDLRIVTDEHAGHNGRQVGIVASISTQSPYYEDWIRDGSFFNETLDRIGHPGLVRRHNAFYVSTQHKSEQGAPPGSPLTTCFQTTPDGSWFMNNWVDGPDAGVFPWEIDETSLGLWTLWRHYRRIKDPHGRTRRRGYLERVYPAIRRSAQFLVAFRDPTTGLPPGTACEDDNPPKPGQPTMHSSGPVLLAMRSAARAAAVLGRKRDAASYRARADELAKAIDDHYDVAGGAWTTGNGDGGWALWPERIKGYANPRMRAQAAAAWKDAAPTFKAPDGPRTGGAYEAKALLGLAHWARAVGDEKMLRRVKRGLEWIAEVEAGWQKTGILGEFWQVRDGKVISAPAQPHAWEETLFYLTSIKAYGTERYHPAPAPALGIGGGSRHRVHRSIAD